MFVLDTNTLIYLSRGDTRVADFVFKKLKDGNSFLISVITLIEFLSYPAISSSDQTFFITMMQWLEVWDLDYTLAMQAVLLRKIYKLKLGDSIIAAFASV